MPFELKVVALYPLLLRELSNRTGVRTRHRKDQVWTQVECTVVNEDGKSVARPVLPIPAGTPAAVHRIQLRVARAPDLPSEVIVPLQPKSETRTQDPEQRLLAPIYNAQHRLVFEFERAEVLHLTQSGDLEIRIVAVDRNDGTVGTRTVYRFHSGYAALAARCSAYLSGSVDLFPAPTPRPHQGASVPQGEANLVFGAREEKPSVDRSAALQGEGTGTLEVTSCG